MFFFKVFLYQEIIFLWLVDREMSWFNHNIIEEKELIFLQMYKVMYSIEPNSCYIYKPYRYSLSEYSVRVHCIPAGNIDMACTLNQFKPIYNKLYS